MSELRQRIPSPTKQDEQPQLETKDDEPRLKHGIFMQIVRSLLLLTWFDGCSVCILAMQLIGAPLYFINKDYFYAYMAMTKQCFGIIIITVTQWGSPTLVRISGDETVRGQLHLTADGRLKTNFSNRLVFIANHQVYTDWLYLWWITYTSRMHGHIYIILKESLKYLPVLGQGMMFYGFIFMARKWESDKPRLQHRLEKLKTRHSGPMSGTQSLDPMWLLIFPEGTNLSTNTKRISDKYGEKTGVAPLKHMILPRSTGLFFCLQQLKGTVDWVYDCTIGYEGPPKGCYPDRYFTLRSTYGQGRPPKSVNMHWRRWALDDIPLDDQKVFEAWLLERWREKDDLLDQFFETGRFPTSLESSIDSTGVTGQQKTEASRGYLETTIRLTHWYEIGQIFGILGFWQRRDFFLQTPSRRAAQRPPTENMAAAVENGHANGLDSLNGAVPADARFSDIPSAIDIPASTFDSEVEVSLEELPDDPTELCTLLENEKAAKNFWVIIALAYAKQKQFDHAIEILQKGLASVAHGATKEKLVLLGWVCWLLMLKSRQAPRVAPEGAGSEARTKDYYLQQATSTLNEASRLNPSHPPLFLARGVLSLLRASLLPPKPARPGIPDNSERVEMLRQALKCFEEAAKGSGGRNVMAYLGLARAQYSLGKYAEALVTYQHVLGKMPSLTDPDPRIGVGCCLWQLGFKDRAKDAWERALFLNPKSKVANVLLASYYLHNSSQYPTSDPRFGELYKTSMTHTSNALKLDKDYPMTCARFAGYKLIRKDYQAVEILARKAIEQTDVMSIASDGWFLLGRKAHYEGDTAKATEFFNRSDQARGGVDSGYLPAKFGVVQMQVKSTDLDGAKFRLEKIIQQTKSSECMSLLGALLAEDVFSAQASGSKDDKSADATKAIGLFESVRSLWKDSTKNISPDESVLIYLSRLYETTAPEKSMQCLTQLEEMQMEQVPDQDRPQDIEDETAFKAALRDYLPPQLLNNIGCFLYQSDKAAQAKDLFQSALTACTRSEESEGEKTTDALVTTISYNLARTLEALDIPDEAKKTYESLLERHSDYTEANARMTYLALRQSPTDEGPKRMTKLYESDSTNLEVRALFGWYLSKSKKRVANIAEDNEQRHYKHTLQHFDKHDKYALTGMGNVHLLAARDMRRETDQDKEKRRKMYERAVEFFHKALQLDSKNAYAAQGIAIALVDDRKDFTGAVQVFSKVKDTVKDASVYLNLGHAYGELKQYARSIENYELALSKDRARDTQVLACLGRVWWLRGKHEKNLSAMQSALDYASRALAVAPEQVHLEFNVAFVQNQIAVLVNSLPEMQRTVQDLQQAAEGLEKAIETFRRIAQVKNPPYPPGSLEQRANMGRNTISKQLERSIQSQKDFEEKNALKLQKAREARDAELKRREEEVRKAQEAELERKRQLAEQRQKMVEETQRLAIQRAEEQRAREAVDFGTDSETGEKQQKRKAKKTSKRKKKEDDDIVSDGRSVSVSRSDGGDASPAPKKRRRLERRGGAGKAAKVTKEKPGKYKSSELVVDSDEEDEDDTGAAAQMEAEDDGASRTADDLFDQDDEEEDAVVTPAQKDRGRVRSSKRVVDDSDDEDVEPAAAAAVNEDEEMEDVADE